MDKELIGAYKWLLAIICPRGLGFRNGGLITTLIIGDNYVMGK